MKLVVGLGNPGRAYANTRHNAGWMALDAFAAALGTSFRKNLFKPLFTAKASLEGAGNLLLVKPATYMNDSGNPLPALMRPMGATAKDVLVVVDDVNLPVGKLRIREGGSAGGHNGLKSVASHLGTEAFPRLRIGVGAKRDGETLTNHVLGRFGASERKEMDDAVERAAEAIRDILVNGTQHAMNQFNGGDNHQ